MTTPTLPLWKVDVAAHCPRVVELGYGCMAELTTGCDQLAVGHARLVGGPYEGAVVVVACREHLGSPEGIDDVKAILVELVAAGFLDLRTGGPGVHGYPPVRHGDHIDDLRTDC